MDGPMSDRRIGGPDFVGARHESEVTPMEAAYANRVGGRIGVEVEESVAVQVGQIAVAFCILLAVAALKGMI